MRCSKDLSEEDFDFQYGEAQARLMALEAGKPTEADSDFRRQAVANAKPLNTSRPIDELIAEADANLARFRQFVDK